MKRLLVRLVGQRRARQRELPYRVLRFAFQRELELYVQAGIPAAQALKIATWNGAKYSDRLNDLGSIDRGKRADLLLVVTPSHAFNETLHQLAPHRREGL